MAPDALSVIVARLAESWTRQRLRSAAMFGSMKASKCRKSIRPWSKLDATIKVSPRGSTRGPSTSTAAAPRAAMKVVFPPPRAKDRAASPAVAEHAPKVHAAAN